MRGSNVKPLRSREFFGPPFGWPGLDCGTLIQESVPSCGRPKRADAPALGGDFEPAYFIYRNLEQFHPVTFQGFTRAAQQRRKA